MSFTLFILVNVLLFVRPAEIVPELENVPIYEIAILLALAVSLPLVLGQLTPGRLAARPITVCVVGLFTAVVLSHLSRGSVLDARLSGAAFAKIVFYFLLLTGVISSEARLFRFLGWLTALVVTQAVLGLLQFHGVLDIPSLATFRQRMFEDGLEESHILARLCGSGIFNDPNDLCIILVWGVV